MLAQNVKCIDGIRDGAVCEMSNCSFRHPNDNFPDIVIDKRKFTQSQETQQNSNDKKVITTDKGMSKRKKEEEVKYPVFNVRDNVDIVFISKEEDIPHLWSLYGQPMIGMDSEWKPTFGKG